MIINWKLAAWTVVLLMAGQLQSDMKVPTVKHEIQKTTTEYDNVTRSCPVGYEGHYVDERPGFDMEYSMGAPFSGYSGLMYGEPAFTICFKKEFMDAVRKNKDFKSMRPQPPRGV